jgi:hypothetical protein
MNLSDKSWRRILAALKIAGATCRHDANNAEAVFSQARHDMLTKNAEEFGKLAEYLENTLEPAILRPSNPPKPQR